MQLLFDFLPVIAFFVAYKLADIYVATMVIIAATVVQVSIHWVRTRRVHVLCPGFVSDCLETLEEIALEGGAIFRAAGGSEYRALPCLNESPAWIAALAAIATSSSA